MLSRASLRFQGLKLSCTTRHRGFGGRVTDLLFTASDSVVGFRPPPEATTFSRRYAGSADRSRGSEGRFSRLKEFLLAPPPPGRRRGPTGRSLFLGNPERRRRPGRAAARRQPARGGPGC